MENNQKSIHYWIYRDLCHHFLEQQAPLVPLPLRWDTSGLLSLFFLVFNLHLAINWWWDVVWQWNSCWFVVIFFWVHQMDLSCPLVCSCTPFPVTQLTWSWLGNDVPVVLYKFCFYYWLQNENQASLWLDSKVVAPAVFQEAWLWGFCHRSKVLLCLLVVCLA